MGKVIYDCDQVGHDVKVTWVIFVTAGLTGSLPVKD